MSLKDDLLKKASSGGKFQPSQNVDRRSPSKAQAPKQETHLDLNSLFDDQGNDNSFDNNSFDSGVEEQQGFEENQSQDFSSQDFSDNDFEQENDQNQEFTIPEQNQEQQQYQDQYSQQQMYQQPQQQYQPQQQFNPYQQGYSQSPFAQVQQQQYQQQQTYQQPQQSYQSQSQYQPQRQQPQTQQSYQPVPEDYQGNPEDSATLEEKLLLLAKETVLNDIANTFDSQLVTKAALQQLISFYLDNTDSPYTNGSAVLIAVIDEILASDYTQEHYKDLIPMILNSVKDDLSMQN